MDNEVLHIQNCQLGQLDSFSVLYEKYVDEIYKFVYLKTYDREKCEDITSEVFIKAMNSISTFKIGKAMNFRAWLYKIAYNQVIDTFKREKETTSFEDYIDKGMEDDIWKKIDDKEKLKQVFWFLDTQKGEQKDIVIMRIWSDMSYKEIAEITGKSEINCKKIFSRTMALVNANFVLFLGLFLYIIL
jgi:RNA polymerase sigma-70 factor, ECF subfamily